MSWRREVWGSEGSPLSSSRQAFNWETGEYWWEAKARREARAATPERTELDKNIYDSLWAATDPNRPEPEQAEWRKLEEQGAPEQEVNLERSRDRYNRAKDWATGLGEEDADGKTPPGVVERAFRAIDTPRSALVNSARAGASAGILGGPQVLGGAIADAIRGEESDDEAVARFREMHDRREGFGDTRALKWSEDAGRVEKGVKGVAAFLGDVATDPLTYVSFGGSVMGRGIGAKGAREIARRQAPQVVDDLARGGFRQGGKVVGSGDGALRVMAEELPAHQIRTLLDGVVPQQGLAQMSKRELLDIAQSQGMMRTLADQGFSVGVAQRYAVGGGTATRRFLEQFGDTGREVWKALPADLQGGVRVRLPFVRETSEMGVRTPIAFRVPGTGGGQMLERTGLGFLSNANNAARHTLRNMPGTGWLARHASGELGSQHVAMLNNAYRNAGGDDAFLYADYAWTLDAMNAVKQSTAHLDNVAHQRVAQAHWLVNGKGPKKLGIDGGEVKRSFNEFYQRRDLMPTSTDGLSPEQAAGWEAARSLHSLLDDVRDQALEVFDGNYVRAMGVLNDYTPRVRTREEAARGLLGRQGAGGTTPVQTRTQYWTSELGPDGQPQMRWMTQTEANLASGRDVFVEDPFQAVADYATTMRGKIRQERLIKTLEEGGVLVRPGESAADAAARAANTPQGMQAMVDPERIQGFSTIEEIDEYFTSVFETVGRMRQPAKSAEQIGVEYKAWAAGRGMTEMLGSGRKDALSDGVQARLTGLFGPETVGDLMVEQFPRAADPTQWRRFVGDFWQPFFTTQKALMTVHRGPGYVSRNVAGGIWNAYLAGVRPGHWKLAAGMRTAHMRANHTLNQAARRGASPDEAARLAGDRFERLVRKSYGSRADDLMEAWDAFHYNGLTGVHPGSRLHGVIETQTKGSSSGIGRDGVRRSLAAEGDTAMHRVQNVVLEKNPWLKRVMQPMVETSEDFLRFGSFLKGVDDFGLADGGYAAGLLVRGTQFDYSDLSRTERTFLKNIVPFYTWTRNAVPLQFRAMVLEPGRVMTAKRLHDMFGRWFEEEDEDQLEELPRWVRDSFGFQTTWRTRNDDPISLGMLWGEPLLDLNRMLRDPSQAEGLVGDMGLVNRDELINNMNPFAKASAEVLLNRDSFTGASLDRDYEAPGWAKLVPGLTYESPDGEVLAKRKALRAIEQVLPPIGQVQRLFPELLGTERLEARKGTSWAAQMTAAPVSTLDPWQVSSEMFGRSERIEDDLEATYPNITERQRFLSELARHGLTPEEARDMFGVADMPAELLDTKSVMTPSQAERQWLDEMDPEERKELRELARWTARIESWRMMGYSEDEIAEWVWGKMGDEGLPLLDTGLLASPFLGEEGPFVTPELEEWLRFRPRP